MKHKNNYSLFLLLLVMVLLSGCPSRSYTKSRSAVLADAEGGTKKIKTIEEERQAYDDYLRSNRERLYSLLDKRQEEQSISGSGDYKIGQGDKITVKVFGVEELESEVLVSQSGFIRLPLIGSIQIAGSSLRDATTLLAKRYSSQIRNPQVALEVTEFGSQKVTVIGEVESPGAIPLVRGKNSILDVVGLAGGILESAGNFVTFIPATHRNQSLVELAKSSLEESAEGEKKSNSIELPLALVMGMSGKEPIRIPVRGGDTVIIPASGQIQVEGEVENRGSYELGENATLLGALAAAGGPRYSANLEEVEIIRVVKGTERRVLVSNLEKMLNAEQENPYLKNGDIVRVPSLDGRRVRGDLFNNIIQFINIGVQGQNQTLN